MKNLCYDIYREEKSVTLLKKKHREKNENGNLNNLE